MELLSSCNNTITIINTVVEINIAVQKIGTWPNLGLQEDVWAKSLKISLKVKKKKKSLEKFKNCAYFFFFWLLK